MSGSRRLAAGLALCLLGAGSLAAQRDPTAAAFELERRGAYAEAADAYRTVLEARPDDLSALLGLERTLLPLRRSAEILPFVRTALAQEPISDAVYGVAVRAWISAEQPESARVLVERWSRALPGDEAPYRELGNALLSRRDRDGARRAYLAGRARLGTNEVLAAELAQLDVLDGRFDAAAREWLRALVRLPGYRASALATLSQAPPPARAGVLDQLERGTHPAGRRLSAELRARWGEPLAGYRLLRDALSGGVPEQIEALRQFLEQVRGVAGPEARRVQGMVLEALAERTTGPASARLRLEAAQAYAEGVDPAAARRMLATLAGDREAPPGLAAGATATLIGVLVAEGHLAEADARLREFSGTLTAEEFGRLRRRVASGWAQAGDLIRAEAALEGDSTVEGLSLAGRLRVYRGDLRGATDLLRAAGPFAGTREEATARTALLALIQPIQDDSLPALGRALLALERGDSAGAVAGLASLAEGLPSAGGGAELRLLAGRIEAARGRAEPAERLLRAAADSAAPATAPAAELELARLLSRLGRSEEAAGLLEHLILAYPGSAVVPQARRFLDEIRGRIPST